MPKSFSASRDGTDFTALFLAQRLNAKCIPVKDVDGKYESNPADVDRHSRRYCRASYKTTVRVAGELVQPKAVHFADEHGRSFEISAIGAHSGTVVGDVEDAYAIANSDGTKPLRVVRLGCGTVGGGVYERLAALPDIFEITGVVNLDQEKAIAAGGRSAIKGNRCSKAYRTRLRCRY